MLEIEPMLCDLWSQTQRVELWKTSGELVTLGIDNQPQMSPCKGGVDATSRNAAKPPLKAQTGWSGIEPIFLD